VAPGSNNARVVCPNKDIIPSPTEFDALLVESMQILFLQSVAVVQMIELLPVLIQGLNVLNYWQAFLKKPLQLMVFTLLRILDSSAVLGSSSLCVPFLHRHTNLFLEHSPRSDFCCTYDI